MSIFPKRTIQGTTVTIHWNFNTAHLKDKHLCPLVKIGVKDPKGNVTILFENHVVAFPEENENKEVVPQKLKYLNKNTPLLVLASYLEGACKREKLVEILTNIQAGRHYYFTYNVPDNAPLGKYTLVSEVHNNGNIKYSKTHLDDHFWVEKVSLINVKKEEKIAMVCNHSEEKTPVKIVRCFINSEGCMKTEMEAFEMNPNETKSLSISTGNTFLLYNEEREIVPLLEETPIHLIKNHEILLVSKSPELNYLMKKDTDEAFSLTSEAKELWDKADGLLTKNSLSKKELEIFKEMEAEGLIKQVRL
ncbi:hypothetical protein MHM83_14485 [Tenacibaculum sp. Mcav3-52]|uniref:hypothetical protein n=1 Tax=Tenacibaculum sp. Mcav3-52 TaxID=2917762 RepID=UPI001EF25010|nr:hypothetical protein [Tenacibaculum sp. Mcav3-52]MCG7503076.1 hypothetical protein [Tenacibaculum sp. Mcav3-52]